VTPPPQNPDHIFGGAGRHAKPDLCECTSPALRARGHPRGRGRAGGTIELGTARRRVTEIAGRWLIVIVGEITSAGWSKISVSITHVGFLGGELTILLPSRSCSSTAARRQFGPCASRTVSKTPRTKPHRSRASPLVARILSRNQLSSCWTSCRVSSSQTVSSRSFESRSTD